jgi:hypothetical protein
MTAWPLMSRVVAGALALAVAAGAQADNGIDKKRREPVYVPPLIVGGLKYEAPRLGTPFGYAQDGGIVVARRADTGDLVWTRRVYTVARDPRMEGDKQDVFIKDLTLTTDGKRVVIVNERGQRFEMSLDGGGVSAMP